MRPELIMLDEVVDGDTVTAVAVLIRNGLEYRGQAHRPADARVRLDAVCEATLIAALLASDVDPALELGGVAITDVGHHPIAMALVHEQSNSEPKVYVGTARVRNDGVVKAAARALMDAVNRPLYG